MNHSAASSHPIEEFFSVSRTARYARVGTPSDSTRECWVACHGYRQLARRFLLRFRTLADSSRLVLAPEGLSRFYVHPKEGRHGEDDFVGASWMTREARGEEISDYVNFLDRLHDDALERTRGAGGAIEDTVALGFSQGGHTAARWAVFGRVPLRALILWGSYLPKDLPEAEARERLGSLELILVQGDTDEHRSDRLHDAQVDRLEAWGVSHRTVRYPGGHQIDGATLREIADSIRR